MAYSLHIRVFFFGGGGQTKQRPLLWEVPFLYLFLCLLFAHFFLFKCVGEGAYNVEARLSLAVKDRVNGASKGCLNTNVGRTIVHRNK
jgi:hypothetical protein